MVLKHPVYLLLFASFATIFMIILIAVPATTIPGNDFVFQISLMRPVDLALLGALSVLTALAAIFHVYIVQIKRDSSQNLKLAGGTTVSFISGLVASIFGTATCAVCVSTLVFWASEPCFFF